MKLMGTISVDFNVADQLLSVFIRYLEKHGSTMRQYISHS
jgi:hypothetical protein